MSWDFIHVPRTAGTSIRAAIGWGPTWGPRGRQVEHLPARVRPDGFKFSFCRNIYSRAVSLYRFTRSRIQGPERIAVDTPARAQAEFEAWLYAGMPDAGYFERDVRDQDRLRPLRLHIGQPWEMTVAAPQTAWTHDEDGRCLVDAIGSFEFLERDFGFFCKRIGIDLAPELPHLNRTNDGAQPFRSLYTAAAQREVERIYSRDFEALPGIAGVWL